MTRCEIAASVLRLIADGEYQIDGRTICFRDEQSGAVNGTRLYSPEQLNAMVTPEAASPHIQVIDRTTQVAAYEMAKTGSTHVGVLNFASARNPGGGFLNGAIAQEEDLCRCSGLYPCLLQCPTYYEFNTSQSSLLYSDYAIFSPHVPFFKTEGTGRLLSEPVFVSVITAPAPNSGPLLRYQPEILTELQATFLRRWRNILHIAQDQGITQLVLGAWGCGAFGGDPALVSSTAKEAVQTAGNGIDEIVFAIPGTGRKSKANLDVFLSTFETAN